MMASLMDGPLESETPRLTHAENLTTSQLNFTPSTHDQDKVLTCTAQNEVFPSVNRYIIYFFKTDITITENASFLSIFWLLF